MANNAALKFASGMVTSPVQVSAIAQLIEKTKKKGLRYLFLILFENRLVSC